MRDGLAPRVAALEARVAALEARLATRGDVYALVDTIREHFPDGADFLAREIFEASELDTAKGLALRAELVAARIRSPKQLGRLLLRAGVQRIGTIREGTLWRI